MQKIEENNRMGKTRDLFKKISDTKGAFHARMGTIKDRKAMEQKQKILRRSDKSTQKNYTKKCFMTKIITMVPDILKCDVKWALESITTNKASGGDGIPVELFQILKDEIGRAHV